MSRGLILTVGDSPEPLEFSLRHTKPVYVCFLCTAQSRSHLDRIVAAGGLTPSRFQVFEVTDKPSEAAILAHQVAEAHRWLQGRGLQADEIAVDATGGRKWMSSAATLMAGALGLPMAYVEAKYREGRPDPATMQVISLANVLSETGIVEAGRAVSLFNVGEFSAAAAVFTEMQQRVSEADLRELAGILADLSILLEKWDRFLHLREPLAEQLAAVRLRLARNRYMAGAAQPIVERLTRLEMAALAISRGVGPIILVDLLENAQRCRRRARYDDATARAYRALEATAQWILRQKNGVETGAFAGTSAKLKSATLGAVQGFNGGTLPEKIALSEAWWVIALEGDPVAVQIGAENEKTGRWELSKKLRGCLESRNESILAHGFKAVGEKAAADLLDEVERVVCLALGEDKYGMFREQVTFPILPGLAGGDSREAGGKG